MYFLNSLGGPSQNPANQGNWFKIESPPVCNNVTFKRTILILWSANLSLDLNHKLTHFSMLGIVPLKHVELFPDF
jgi:hypothetical protein